ncbi:OmpA family protein [Actinokineospora sp. NBRC 105648]|uniref:OmpA family protein n=1 Tax=Actinokineospora sp. NBRC 105648 TaxID=3032206 RepID=UPI0024A22B2B|nr:OmpA family protein [Actinokineospora sp. NBRC 105648]GLZ42427.1 hypothetical protein Acsp05_60510 [Actinokineospora sp. NBRC 105648]
MDGRTGNGRVAPALGTVAPRTGILLGAVLVGAAVLASGCGAAPAADAGETLVIAVTAVANEPAPTLTTAARTAVQDALNTDHARLRVVVSGMERPTVVADEDLRLLRGSQVENDAARRAELTARRMSQVAEVVGGAAGQVPNLDLFTLLDHVARTPGRVTAVVISSGVQTTGPLALARLGWDQVGTAQVVAQAEHEGLVPDLRGKRVVFSSLGEVRQPQEVLPPPLRERLARMWLGICEAGGGDCSVDREPVTGGPPHSSTPVPTVPVPHAPALTAPAAAPVELPSDILFGPDSADLLPDAEPLLRQVVQALPPGAHLRLEGRTASVGPADTARDLSLRRAEAVRDSLVLQGIPANTITTTGLGFDRPLAPDRDTTGNLIPTAAQRNRTVTLAVRP